MTATTNVMVIKKLVMVIKKWRENVVAWERGTESLEFSCERRQAVERSDDDGCLCRASGQKKASSSVIRIRERESG